MELKLKTYTIEYADFYEFDKYRIFKFTRPDFKILNNGTPIFTKFKVGDIFHLSDLRFDFEEECYVVREDRCGETEYTFYDKNTTHEAVKNGFGYSPHSVYFIIGVREDINLVPEYIKLKNISEDFEKQYREELKKVEEKIKKQKEAEELEKKKIMYEQLKKEFESNE